MPLYKPSELTSFLQGLGISPKKSLSQNFLIDGNIIKKIISASDVHPGDIVLEIGSGPGSLTEALLEAGANVLAVERDDILAKALDRFKVEGKSLDIYCEDIMKFPVDEILVPKLKPGQKAKVIANLPYHLTTPIISHLIKMRNVFSSLTLMVQDEVAKRFTAHPNTSDYGSYSVFLNFYCNPKYAFLVSRNCFYPAPKVQSAVVVLELKEPPAVSNEDKFFELTRTAFKQRRKMLRGTLKDLYGSQTVTDALVRVGLNPQARPEDLSLDQFISLFETLQTST